MRRWKPEDWALFLIASTFPLVVIGLFSLALIAALTT